MDDNIDWVVLAKVPDLITRGALISRLGEDQIEVYAPDQDAIVNLSSSSPNLSLEGYSAVFDGYRVYVNRRKLGEAQKIWADFEAEMYKPDPNPRETDHPHKFYMMAATSFLFPIITHFLAVYHLREAIRKKQKLSGLKLIFSILVMVPSLFLAWIYLTHLWEQIKDLI